MLASQMCWGGFLGVREEAASGELFRAVLQGHFLNAADQSDQHLKAEGFTPCCLWINGKTKGREHFHRR